MKTSYVCDSEKREALRLAREISEYVRYDGLADARADRLASIVVRLLAHVERPNWSRDDLQFPRLISEIGSNCVFVPATFAELCSSMDLSKAQINKLFDRADAAWQLIKADVCPAGGGR